MRFLVKSLNKVRNVIDGSMKAIQRKTDVQYAALEKWYKEDPHSLRRSSFDFLGDDSIVFDLGGYEGQWASDIAARYSCNIFIFEPVKEYYDIISDRFKFNRKIKCFQWGLSDKASQVEINVNEFASSIFQQDKHPSKKESISLKSFSDFRGQNQLETIDLMKINIEGGEYDLLEGIISNGEISCVNNLLIQFHNFVPDANKRKQNIKKNLAQTHQVIFDFEYVWEHWKLK